MIKVLAFSLVAGVSGMLVGCKISSHVDRLLKHEQFEDAARAAPDFVKDALKTIADLEYELQTRR